MSELTPANGNGHDAERARVEALLRMYSDERNAFIREHRPRKWNSVITYMCSTVHYLLRTKQLDLERRIEALEAGAKNFRYCGQWHEGEKYLRGNFVSIPACGIYHCDRDTMLRPGGDGAGWSLVCKAGRDGKDFVPGRTEKSRRSQDELVTRRR
jgi:hypothetical protein